MNIYFAADELKKNKGMQFDPKIVDTFLKYILYMAKLFDPDLVIKKAEEMLKIKI